MGNETITGKIGLSIPVEMHEWLESKEGKRKVPNKSGLFQDAIEKVRNPKPQKIHPMSYLIIIMGMAFGVGCIIGSISFNFDYLFTTTLFLLGAVVLLTSLVTMIKEGRRINASRIH